MRKLINICDVKCYVQNNFIKNDLNKDGKNIFYTATKVGKNRNLEVFSSKVLELLMPGMGNISFKTIEAVLDFINKNIGDEKGVLVIDELPYWAEKDEAL